MANPATQGALQLARVLALALVTGPVILWAIGWVLTDGGTTSIAGADAPLTPFMALGIWAAVALPAFVSALWARRRAMDRAVAGEETRVLPLLIVAWALLEGAAILSGVFFCSSVTPASSRWASSCSSSAWCSPSPVRAGSRAGKGPAGVARCSCQRGLARYVSS